MNKLIIVFNIIIFNSCIFKKDICSIVRPNILFIVVDDLRPMLGCYGDNSVKSPCLDKLSSEGILFLNSYAQFAWCSPSRTSVLTGLRPDKTRVYDLETHFRETVPNVITLPQYFKNKGYQTFAFGKVYHSFLDDSLSWSEPTWEPTVKDPLKHYLLPENIKLAESRNGYAFPFEKADADDDMYPDGQIVTEAIKKINEISEKPFFIAVGFYKPHLPYNAPNNYWNLYNKNEIKIEKNGLEPINSPEYAFLSKSEHNNYFGISEFHGDKSLPDSLMLDLRHGYMACVSYIDNQIYRLITALDENDLLDNTIVVVWGDHGYKLGEFGHWSKHTNYDIDTRVPLIIKPISKYKNRGIKLTQIIELLDIYPTIIDLVGFEIPNYIDGKTLLPVISNKIHTDLFAYSQFIRNNTLTYTNYKDATTIGQSVRTNEYRFIRWIHKNNPANILAMELYDLKNYDKEVINEAHEKKFQDLVSYFNELLDKKFEPEVFN